jgi:protein-S-isoprenylcysteine O-methyltransferase Ste14
MSYGIRPSTTEHTAALWAKSAFNAVWFFAVFMVALPYVAAWAWPATLPLPLLPRRALGAVLALGGLGVWIACLDHFSRRGRGTPFPLDAPRQLVSSGPFAVVRNPIIVGELAVVWGVASWTAISGILAYALLVTTAAHAVVTRIEEPELRERFGAEYDAYCRRVPRWFPRWRS